MQRERPVELRDHLAVEERPRRLAVQQQHRRRRCPRRGSACAGRPGRRSAARTCKSGRSSKRSSACGRRPFRILLTDDGESSARPMIAAPLGRSLPHMKGGAMPTYSIHHFTVARNEAGIPAEGRTADRDERPRGVRRKRGSTAACRVTKQSWSSGREALRLPARALSRRPALDGSLAARPAPAAGIGSSLSTYGAHRLVDADVLAGAFREEPAVLEHLVEDLGRGQRRPCRFSGTAATVGSNTSWRQRDATTDSESGRFCFRSSASRKRAMSFSIRRAWFSCASRPVRRSRRWRWWPGSTTCGSRRSR